MTSKRPFDVELTEPIIEFQVPVGLARFVSIYKPWGGPGLPLYGLSVPLDQVPRALTEDVKTSVFGGDAFVQLRCKFRPEVHVRGFHSDDPEQWCWLERQHKLLELRNLGRDALIREHPLYLAAQRYRYDVRGNSGYAIGLKRLEVIAQKEG